eukprot:1046915-Pleurochrysis_carterae.AAC.1
MSRTKGRCPTYLMSTSPRMQTASSSNKKSTSTISWKRTSRTGCRSPFTRRRRLLPRTCPPSSTRRCAARQSA